MLRRSIPLKPKKSVSYVSCQPVSGESGRSIEPLAPCFSSLWSQFKCENHHNYQTLMHTSPVGVHEHVDSTGKSGRSIEPRAPCFSSLRSQYKCENHRNYWTLMHTSPVGVHEHVDSTVDALVSDSFSLSERTTTLPQWQQCGLRKDPRVEMNRHAPWQHTLQSRRHKTHLQIIIDNNNKVLIS